MFRGHRPTHRVILDTSQHLTDAGELAYQYLWEPDVLVLDTAGTILPIPAPTIDVDRVDLIIKNSSSGYCFITSASGFLGVRETVAIAPYSSIRLLGVELAVNVYTWMIDNESINAAPVVKSWTPTLAWTGGTPGAETITKSAYYCVVDGTCFFNVKITTTDGAGATALTATLPGDAIPRDVDMDIPLNAVQTIDGTPSNALGYIDGANATAETRAKIQFRGMSTFTDDKTCVMQISGFYELHGWEAFTPADTWGTATPDTLTKTGRLKVLENKVVLFVMNFSSADGNAADSLDVELPIDTPDRDTHLAARAIELQNASYTDPLPTINKADAAAANRDIAFEDWTTAADGEAIGVYCAGSYELSGWDSYTPALDSSVTSPATPTLNGFLTVIANRIMFFSIYLISTDGNDCDEMIVSMPGPANPTVGDMTLNGFQSQHSDVVKNPLAYVDSDQTTPTSRKLKFLDWVTADDTEAVAFHAGGFVFL